MLSSGRTEMGMRDSRSNVVWVPIESYYVRFCVDTASFPHSANTGEVVLVKAEETPREGEEIPGRRTAL